MKRSEINTYLQQAADFFQAQHFYLPPFAFWSPSQWTRLSSTTDYMRARGLGWDVTDFGSGNFAACGLLLFTIRNGLVGDPAKIFAEKIMMVRVAQRTPFHFHFQKTEDIINRGGGDLILELYNSDPQGKFAATEVQVRCDGLNRVVPAGGKISLKPGESITLVPGLYHSFYATGSHAMVGEVSSVNDDTKDNRFYEPLPRFANIVEDVPPLYLLCSDYHHAV
ncbi:MAG: D-lyxose/D-mannose family sugar isomerase [Planctomycetia bacterium]|jgi:D-lyxose ketol-isomerase|nr:D-lyxose/D-mannose family sugar isomerase [Planctomycetia bacterium]